MRLTESHLRKIVKEELKKVLNEIGPVADMPPQEPSAYEQTIGGEEQKAIEAGMINYSDIYSDGEMLKKHKKQLENIFTFKKTGNSIEITEKNTNNKITIDSNLLLEQYNRIIDSAKQRRTSPQYMDLSSYSQFNEIKMLFGKLGESNKEKIKAMLKETKAQNWEEGKSILLVLGLIFSIIAFPGVVQGLESKR